ncbi:flagellar export protein FliJ [Caldalkalibacillus mannanilyticus]|uniref:flagellar export protein FliJ n=1 Tax=Caldalkalibacillus mannanilyticus TaxID=1418 RepID=UPI0004689DCF|nr:flagellar export protein FliJ [Caldalkalibacillus mannanilyticus]
MSKYIYPYQRILEMKVKEKENAQLLMAKAVQKQTNIESRIMDLQSTITTVQERLSSEQNVGMPILQLRMIGDYVSNLQKRVGIERIQLDFAKKNVDKKQEVLRDALKEEKTWDLLKEKKQQEHLEFIKQKEQSQLDEISNQMFYRQMEAKG